MMEWSEMLPELLDIIAQKYITCYEDYSSFAGVCKSWRLAAAGTYRNSNGPPSRLPSLMLAGKSDDRESRGLFLLSNKSIRKIQLPEAYDKVCKSSCGWLLTVGKDFASQLINPLSREIINLPKANTFPEFIHPSHWRIAIQKLVLLIESKLVIVISGYENKLGFCHIGDNMKWTSVVEPNKGISAITFYNRRIYSFDADNTIRACNFDGKDPTVLVYVATLPEDFYDECASSPYIVGLDDGDRKQLLLIIKEGVYNDGECPETYKTQSFLVFAYDLESGNWSKVKDFGRKTLFVGFSSSFWTEDTTGVIKGNCIYYTDDEDWEYRNSKEGGGRDMGIYHLSDGTFEHHFTGESRSHLTPPIWLQSM